MPTRRQFLGAALGAGACAGAGAALWLGSRSAGRDDPPPSLVACTRRGRALGSEASITALHASRPTAEAAAQAAFDELERVEDLMSIYRPHSQLSRLNRDGRLPDPHPALVEVLRHAQSLSARSGGAFDVTVQPLWALYAGARRRNRLPSAAEVAAVKARVDWRRLEIQPGLLWLRGAGTAITLNGIAQGYAADRAVAALRSHGVEHALVNTGEIGALGRKSPTGAWTVGIQHPRRDDAYISLAELEGRCLATSGDYATKFDDDGSCNHLFDPRTGRSPEAFSSVSVAARTSLEADALSTAVFVLGVAKGMRLVAATEGADALCVLKDGRMLATPGFPAV